VKYPYYYTGKYSLAKNSTSTSKRTKRHLCIRKTDNVNASTYMYM